MFFKCALSFYKKSGHSQCKCGPQPPALGRSLRVSGAWAQHTPTLVASPRNRAGSSTRRCGLTKAWRWTNWLEPPSQKNRPHQPSLRPLTASAAGLKPASALPAFSHPHKTPECLRPICRWPWRLHSAPNEIAPRSNARRAGPWRGQRLRSRLAAPGCCWAGGPAR